MLRPRFRCIGGIRPLCPYRRRRRGVGINPDDVVDVAVPLQRGVLVQRPGRVRRRVHPLGNGEVGVSFCQLGPRPRGSFPPQVD